MSYVVIIAVGVVMGVVAVILFRRDLEFELWGVMLGVIAVFVMVVGLAIWGAHTSCLRLGIQVDRNTDFYINGGCFVTLDTGRSVPIDENSLGLLLEIINE